jgi:hypothetical protein
MLPFDDESKVESMSSKNDASLFMIGTHNKKRPNNIVLGKSHCATEELARLSLCLSCPCLCLCLCLSAPSPLIVANTLWADSEDV